MTVSFPSEDTPVLTYPLDNVLLHLLSGSFGFAIVAYCIQIQNDSALGALTANAKTSRQPPTRGFNTRFAAMIAPMRMLVQEIEILADSINLIL
jgi:hypothetical protein